MSAWHIRGIVLPEAVERDVYVADGLLTFTPIDGAETVATDVWLLPGLVDVHAHLALASPARNAHSPREAIEASLHAHLDAGVLALREPGSPVRDAAGLGPAEGFPRVATAGRFLAPPGGYFPGLAREVGADELPVAALEELAAGTGWVKLIGDSPFPGPGIARTYPDDAVAETVRQVHAAGGRVAMHCTLAEVVEMAIAVGIDSVEHGTFLEPGQIHAFAASQTAWVPTMSIDGLLGDFVSADQARCISAHGDVVAAAHEAGVRVLAGTDAGMVAHGLVRHEVQLLARAGMPADAALGAGSWAAREFLGLPGIADGALADLTGYRDDPRDRLDVLADPALVVLDGRVIRRPA
ncbi:amidohydrolase family protein [Nocardioides jejuensis]|uniref:Amidohydrolase n=1 Tax=Nocardioides jejuensis TaxID=2502782 RepID=A0A4R1C0X2_9ACTN|nr:amidohydrolase family protein [Nocardioides jejuensis]TCJ23638.1 amidohydrolase [Nocardioides jejuensis]